ncbi:hypothetical protein FIBSPDRAFT_1044714 [Athelia psychrophila]|uniref:Uncharacterized protein n=1 Tax=Athelia psychrophila TaxID=1759441 RepID=A0A166JB36_9AGAM|nr:hypothetical protein FIBSPDRAFT_1044714 [Fibularhizoctonia sp. CBS 109695]
MGGRNIDIPPFFFRMRAVYSVSRPVMLVFAFVWALIILTPIIGIFGLVQKCSGPVCELLNRLALPFETSIFLHDTLRFGKVKRFFSGQGLHAVSKALLLSGRLYYGVTIGALVVGASGEYVGWPYSNSTEAFYITLSSALACRVFRMLLLYRGGTENTTINTRAVESMIMAAMAGLEAQGVPRASDVGEVYRSIMRT